jgi:hypothetical protein
MTRKRRSAELPPPLLSSSEESIAFLRQRLKSRGWWCFITVDPSGTAAVAKIEKNFFSGEANRDFELLIFPLSLLMRPVGGEGLLGWMSVFLAKKSRLSPSQLARHFDEEGMSHEAEALTGGRRDVIALSVDPERVVRALLLLNDMIGPLPSEEDSP